MLEKAPGRTCSPIEKEAHAGVGAWKDLWPRKKPRPEQVCWQGLRPHGGPTLEQPVPEGLHPVGRTLMELFMED